MIYNYEQDNTNGETWLTSIEYTGNTNASLSTYNKVEFTYENRTDKSISYLKGCKLTNSKILKNIRTYAEGSLVRKYEMQYYLDEQTKLNEVYEYNAHGERYNSIAVGWGSGSTSLMTKSAMNLNTTDNGENGTFYFGDFNGDGRMDFIRVYYGLEGTTYYNFYQLYYFNETSGYFTFQESTKYPANETIRFYPGDFNADGKSDVLFCEDDYTTLWISNGAGFTKTGYYSGSISASEIRVADFDGDSKPEFCDPTGFYNLSDNLTTATITTISLLNSYLSSQLLDINADGKVEIVYQNTNYSISVFSLSSSGPRLVCFNRCKIYRKYGTENNPWWRKTFFGVD